MDLINARKTEHKKTICFDDVTALAPLLQYMQYFKFVCNSDVTHQGA
jgi:hypothetical protein